MALMRDTYTLWASIIASVVLLFVALSNRSWVFVVLLLIYLGASIHAYRKD